MAFGHRFVIAPVTEPSSRVILIEKAANGSPLMADLRHVGGSGIPTPIGVVPKGSKIERLRVQSSRIEAGDLRLPKRAPWLDEFRAELLSFPNGRHDDQVDALTQLLDWHQRQLNLRPKFYPGDVKLFIDGEPCQP